MFVLYKSIHVLMCENYLKSMKRKCEWICWEHLPRECKKDTTWQALGFLRSFSFFSPIRIRPGFFWHDIFLSRRMIGSLDWVKQWLWIRGTIDIACKIFFTKVARQLLSVYYCWSISRERVQVVSNKSRGPHDILRNLISGVIYCSKRWFMILAFLVCIDIYSLRIYT